MNESFSIGELFDSHAHFTPSQSQLELLAIFERMAAAQVTHVLAVGGDAACNAGALAVAKVFPDRVFPALGFSCETTGEPGNLATLEQLLRDTPPAAIGEIGLDFHYYRKTAAAQAELFAEQLRLADLLALPVIVHTREADAETLRVLDSVPWHHDSPRGVIHCFTGAQSFAEALLARGFFISFSGILTFKNAAALRAVAATIPDDRLLIETDSPYLAPIPHRGEKNEPAFVRHVAELLASLRHTDFDTLAALTTRNACRMISKKT